MKIYKRAGVLVATGALVAGLAGLPTAAQAASGVLEWYESDSQFFYTAAPGVVNNLIVRQDLVTRSDGTQVMRFTFNDSQPLNAPHDCTHPDPADQTRVVCLPNASSVGIEGTLGDRDDSLDIATINAFVLFHGGLGADLFTDRGGLNLFYGDAGNDSVRGVYYTDAERGTHCYGGDGADRLIRCDRGEGGAGNDVIYGTYNADVILGGIGNDYLVGSNGNDVIYGNSGDDTIYGNSGNDRLYGGPGRDMISGGPGTDQITQ